MNIGFYDPISQRWIKPRPPKEPEEKPCVSPGEALLNAVEAAALKERNDKIWQYLKQSAEGCNRPTVEAEPATSLIFSEVLRTSPIVVEAPPEYEQVFSLGYSYWKLKDAKCSGQQE